MRAAVSSHTLGTMSQIPPVQEADYSKPPQYVGYQRPGYDSGFQNDPDRLQALMEGYYGLSWSFLATVLTVIAVVALGLTVAGPDSRNDDLGALFGVLVFVAPVVVAGATSYRCNKKIAFGAGWSNGTAILASVLIGVGAVCYGIVGFIVMQTIALGQIKKFGVRGGFLGVRKKDIKARIEQLRAAKVAPPVYAARPVAAPPVIKEG